MSHFARYLGRRKRMQKLSGKKTYLAAAIMVVLAGLKSQGFIDENTYQVVLSVVGALGLAALRNAVK